MAAKMNPDLVRERRKAKFDGQKLTVLLAGSQELVDRKRKIEKIGLENDDFTNGPIYDFLSRPEQYENGVRKAVLMMTRSNELNLTFPEILSLRGQVAFPNEAAPMALQLDMFIPALESQCSPEQKEKWLPKAHNFQILGTYAQTELGHGTHVRGLETTATYDPQTEEFVINSPTLAATKWWPGGLGKTSDHVILMAQLYTNGKCYGVNPFIVQIRDLDTHQPLPGVTVGDIGPKFGYESIDNGFLRFDHLRIPRENMLMKNAQVQKNGTFMKTAKSDKLSYGTMLYVRSTLVKYIGGFGLGQACTIAIRYSCVRRQSELKPGNPEPQILDFQTQQYKLFPLLACSYALSFAGDEIFRLYLKTNKNILEGNVEMLPELHALTACMKAYSTSLAMLGIEQCRMACGGHGYSKASGIPKIYHVNMPGCTYEGENTVMYLQTSRYLMKAYEQMRGGNKLAGSVSYLSQPNNTKSHLGADLDLHMQLDAFRYKAARMVTRAGMKLSKLRARHELYEAWNNTSVDLVAASQAHAEYFVLDTFVKTVLSETDLGVRKVLQELCQLYACYVMSKNAAEFVEEGYMTSDQMDNVQDSMLDLLAKIRPNAVALVDAYDFSDHVLSSQLGRYDGNVYENLLKWAKSSNLNKTEVHSSFDDYVKPFRQEMQKAKL